MKKIAFHSNQLSIRGTEVALYTYAKYNEEILGNKSVIFTFPNRDMGGYQKFKDRFDVVVIEWWEYEKYLIENNFDYLYITKMGINDGYCFEKIPTLIHVVFRFNEPHGHKYFYISDWLAMDQGYSPDEYSLPYICEKLPKPNYNFREKMGIPKDALVFGGYGGATEFNIEFVKEAIKNVVSKHSHIYFIFMNFNLFANHSQIKFFPGNYDLNEKSAFINACDAMIHARSGGETFGLAISEFALANKPVITYGLSDENCHLSILKEKAIIYNNFNDVMKIFENFDSYKLYNDYDLPYKQFSPEIIIEKFKKFIS